MHESSSFRRRAWHAFGLCLLGVLAYVVYAMQLQFTNAYFGFQPVSLRAIRLAAMICLCISLGLSLPTKITKPSHLFLILYGTFVILSYILFASAAYEEGLAAYFRWLSLLIFPFIVIYLLGWTNWSLLIPFELRRETVLLIAVVIVFASVVVAYISTRQLGDLSIADAYDRRMAGRDIFEAGSLIAYLNVMSMNGINPFIAFLGGLLNRKLLALLSLLFAGVFFFSIGVKAPFAFVGLAYLVGLGVRTGRLLIFFDAIIALTAVLFVAFAIEFAVNGYSEVAEYFFRRIFVIPGFNIQHYMEMMFKSRDALWSPWMGVNSDLGPTYLIGAIFYGNFETNANTNAFVYGLAAGGFPGYFGTILLVGAFLKAIDALYEASRNDGYLYLGFLYSILLTEQSATTALASSGVGLLFGLLILSGRGWTRDNKIPRFMNWATPQIAR